MEFSIIFVSSKAIVLFVLSLSIKALTFYSLLPFLANKLKSKIFHYIHCVTPKRVTSCRAHPRVIAPVNTVSLKEMSQRWRAFGNTVSDLTGPRFEPQTSCFRDERVSARSTGRLNHFSSDGQLYVSMAALCRIFIV